MNAFLFLFRESGLSSAGLNVREVYNLKRSEAGGRSNEETGFLSQLMKLKNMVIGSNGNRECVYLKILQTYFLLRLV